MLAVVAAKDAAAQPEESKMYVVAGVPGHTGKVVAETLLAQKKPVRVLQGSRSSSHTLWDWKAEGSSSAG